MSAHLHKTSHKAANNRLIWLHYTGCYAMQDHSLGLRVEGVGSQWGGGENVGRRGWFSGRFVVLRAVIMSVFAQDRRPFSAGFLRIPKKQRAATHLKKRRVDSSDALILVCPRRTHQPNEFK